MDELIIALIGALTGSGVCSIVVVLLQRKWKKNDQHDAIMEKLENIDKRMDKMEAEDEEREARHARIRILRFGDDCSHEVKHSREHFEQVIEDVDAYETYCRDHPDFKNNKAVLTIKLIKETYQKRLSTNDFI